MKAPRGLTYRPSVSDVPMPLLSRIWLSFVCSLRILSDGAFATRVSEVRDGWPELPEPPTSEPSEPPPSSEPPAVVDHSALILLGLLQREGRLVDFLEQDVADFDDADIGAAARVVHQGCRKALRGCASVVPLRDEEEDSEVTIEDGYDPNEVKLDVSVRHVKDVWCEGDAPLRGLG